MSAPIRRLTRPRTPPELRECGWLLCEYTDGRWSMFHRASKTFTPIVDAPGRAIEAAFRLAEPDYERLNKWWRETALSRTMYQIWRAQCPKR